MEYPESEQKIDPVYIQMIQNKKVSWVKVSWVKVS